MPEPREVRAMFGRVAPRYDLLNHVLSLGIDRRWRRRLLARAGEVGGRRALDVACGTGDLSFVLAGAGADVLGVDFTREMLSRAGVKREARAGETGFLQADALRLPFPSASFDIATIAFGLRNLADRGRGLRELARVVRPGGRVLVLEFSMPRNRVFRGLYRFYFTRVLPLLGRLVSGDASAYRYLPDTVLAWPAPDELDHELRDAGLVETGYELLTNGVACISFGSVPG